MSRLFSPLSHSTGPNDHYDVVIIGSGIGGLICGNLLALSGRRTLLVEQHSMVGGYCSGFRRKGFKFDSASHFYPLLGNPNSISGNILRAVGSTTRWIQMDPVDQFHLPDGTRFAVPADFESYLNKLIAEFPEERDSIVHFFKVARNLYLRGILHFFKDVESPALQPYLLMSLRDALDSYFKSDRLKLVLTADCPHWGAPVDATSWVFDSMLRLSYFEGNYFPLGGSQAFANELAERFCTAGGHVLTSATVAKICVADQRVNGVRVSIGPLRARRNTYVRTPCVVSNADMRQTVFQMCGRSEFPTAYCQAIEQLRPTFSCFLSHIGVTGISRELLEQVHGYHWSGWNPDRVGIDSFQCKLFVPTLYDKTLAPPGCHILIVQKVVDFEYDKIADWAAHKAKLESFVLGHLNKIIPGLNDKIVVCLSASAKTSHRFTLNHHGAMLGWQMSCDQLGKYRPDNTSPIEGLHFVGQWTRPGGGITPVIVSASNVANRILASPFGSVTETLKGTDTLPVQLRDEVCL